MGKRASLWLNELYMDYEEITNRMNALALLAARAPPAPRPALWSCSRRLRRIKAVEASIAAELGFDKVVPVSGQTYSRKVDFQVLSALSGLAQSAMKMCTDIRILANFKEMEEPSRRTRSVPPPCPTSAIPCAASASAPWPAM